MCCANMCDNNHVKASSCKGKHTWVCGVVFCHDEICNLHSAVGKEVISVMWLNIIVPNGGPGCILIAMIQGLAQADAMNVMLSDKQQ